MIAIKKKYFSDPAPEQRYDFTGEFSVTLFYQDYVDAIANYEQVLGPPAYMEGEGTHGWKIGNGWLTLLQGNSGNPRNIEVTFVVGPPEQADKLQKAFVQAGGQGDAPSDQLMYDAVRYCPVSDPFGVDLLIISQLGR